MTRRKYFLWNLFTNRFPFAQIALGIVLLCLFIELMFKQDSTPARR